MEKLVSLDDMIKSQKAQKRQGGQRAQSVKRVGKTRMIQKRKVEGQTRIKQDDFISFNKNEALSKRRNRFSSKNIKRQPVSSHEAQRTPRAGKRFITKSYALRQRLSNYQLKKTGQEQKGAPKGENSMIKVSGLDKKINNQEVLELFGSEGKLVKCCLDFDSLGRSKGTASIKYKDLSNAKKAIRKYHSNFLYLTISRGGVGRQQNFSAVYEESHNQKNKKNQLMYLSKIVNIPYYI